MGSDSFLLDSEHLYKMLSTMNEEVFVVNQDMEIVYVNHAAQKFGFHEESVLNQSIFDVFPQLKKEDSTIVKVFSTGNPVIGSICNYITSRGERRVLLTSTYPIIENGKIIGVYELGEDVSGISKSSEELILNQHVYKKNDISLNQRNKENKFYTLDSIIGQNDSIKRLKEKVIIAANSPSNVLIYGETGTGKELAAQSIYSHSKNSKAKPFIAQNCAAIPESLLESILFGSVKGSFTGAENRPGLFELANGGVLFLDEINAMPISLQAKLLRVIQEGQVRRVGAQNEITVDFKLITSTNVKPELLIETGEIRKDLYYRINVLYIEIPPLRDRKDDIPYLVQYFIQKYNKELNKDIVGVDEKTMELFMDYNWPGNIRELQNIIERQFNMSSGKVIRFDEVEFFPYLMMREKDTSYINIKKDERIRLKEAIRELEIKIIKETLKHIGGNISKAARELDIPQQTLNNKIDKYDLRKFVDTIRYTQK